MINTVTIVLAWYLWMVILSRSEVEPMEETQEEEPPKTERSLLDNPLLAACGMPVLYEEAEAVEVWDDVEYLEEQPMRTAQIILEINANQIE